MGAKLKPITIITGLVTMVGSILAIIVEPRQKTTRLRTKYTKPAAASPDIVADRPYLSTLRVIGAIKAKEDAK